MKDYSRFADLARDVVYELEAGTNVLQLYPLLRQAEGLRKQEFSTSSDSWPGCDMQLVDGFFTIRTGHPYLDECHQSEEISGHLNELSPEDNAEISAQLLRIFKAWLRECEHLPKPASSALASWGAPSIPADADPVAEFLNQGQRWLDLWHMEHLVASGPGMEHEPEKNADRILNWQNQRCKIRNNLQALYPAVAERCKQAGKCVETVRHVVRCAERPAGDFIKYWPEADALLHALLAESGRSVDQAPTPSKPSNGQAKDRKGGNQHTGRTELLIIEELLKHHINADGEICGKEIVAKHLALAVGISESALTKTYWKKLIPPSGNYQQYCELCSKLPRLEKWLAVLRGRAKELKPLK